MFSTSTSTSSILGTALSFLLHRPVPDLLEVAHHGLQPTLLLAELPLQLLHDLDLHLGLGGAPVVQDVRPEHQRDCQSHQLERGFWCPTPTRTILLHM